MMSKSIRRVFALTITGLLAASAAQADVPAHIADNDFLSDYSLLESFEDSVADYMYVAPDTFKNLANYSALMVDQPEIFISPDSSYRGVKPDNLKAIADLMRTSLIGRMEEGGYNIVETPGPGVLFLRLALTDLELVKKKRPISGYTPTGFIVQATLNAQKEELARKFRLDYVTVEVEFLDAESGELLLAGLLSKGADEVSEKGKEQTEIIQWEAFDAYLQNLGKRIQCRLGNARLRKASGKTAWRSRPS